MENNKKDSSQIQQTLMDNFQKMATLSLDTMKPLMDTMFENISSAGKTMAEGKMPTLNLTAANKTSKCCPPEETCPPHCIASISRRAMPGERIIVPFVVKNTCSTTKTYRVGIRELKDNDGKMAPTQPQLNKSSVTVDPGRSVRVLMAVDLNGFNNGDTYTAEIVLREKDINQNICFTLIVDNLNETVVTPKDEKKYKLKWQNWQSHFYCEPVTNRNEQNS